MTIPPIPTIIDVVPSNTYLKAYFQPIDIPDKLIWYQISAYFGDDPDSGTIGTGNLPTFSFSEGSLINNFTYKIKGRSWNVTDDLYSEWTPLWGTITPNPPDLINYNQVVANSPATTNFLRNNLAFASQNATINETEITDPVAINKIKTSLVYKNNLSGISKINTLIMPEGFTFSRSFNVDKDNYYYIPSFDAEEIIINNPFGTFNLIQSADDLLISTTSKTQLFTNSQINNSTQVFSSEGQYVSIFGKGSLLFTVQCFVVGTKILCPNGFISIEQLKTGDPILTDDNRIIPIINIYNFKITGEKSTFPVIIPKDALSKDYPNKQVTISPNHAIKFKDKWIVAKNIKNTTRDTSKNEIIYYHIELPNFETDNLVLEGNLVVESLGKNYEEKKKYYKNHFYTRKVIKKTYV